MLSASLSQQRGQLIGQLSRSTFEARARFAPVFESTSICDHLPSLLRPSFLVDAADSINGENSLLLIDYHQYPGDWTGSLLLLGTLSRIRDLSTQLQTRVPRSSGWTEPFGCRGLVGRAELAAFAYLAAASAYLAAAQPLLMRGRRLTDMPVWYERPVFTDYLKYGVGQLPIIPAMRFHLFSPHSVPALWELILVVAAMKPADASPILDLGYTQYKGSVDTSTNTTSFLGIRYAAAPIGMTCFTCYISVSHWHR